MTERNIHQEDQMGLPGLKIIVIQLLRVFFKTCSFIALVLVKNKFFLTLVLCVGLVSGYFYYSIRPVYYKVSMIVQFTELSKKTYAEMLDQLNGLVGTRSKRRLARELNLSESLASKIVFIDSRTLTGESLASDTSTKTKQPFKIILGLNTNSLSDSLQMGIVYYLNNSPYLKTLKEEERKINLFKLSRIETDLNKLDSLKSEYNRFLAFSKIQATFYNSAINPADFYVESSRLLALREETIKSLNVDGSAVSVVDGFKLAETPQSISMPNSVLFFGIAAFLLVFVILSLMEIRKKISRPVLRP